MFKKVLVLFVMFFILGCMAAEINEKAIIQNIYLKGTPYLLTKKILIDRKTKRAVAALKTMLSGTPLSFERYTLVKTRLKLNTEKLVQIPYLFPGYEKYIVSKKLYLINKDVITASAAIKLFEEDLQTLEEYKKTIHCKKHSYYYSYYYDYYYRNRVHYYNRKCMTCNNNQRKAEEIFAAIKILKTNLQNLKDAVVVFKAKQTKYIAGYARFQKLKKTQPVTQVNKNTVGGNVQIVKKLKQVKDLFEEDLITEAIYNKKRDEIIKDYKKENISLKENLLKVKKLLSDGLISRDNYKEIATEFMGM